MYEKEFSNFLMLNLFLTQKSWKTMKMMMLALLWHVTNEFVSLNNLMYTVWSSTKF